MARIEVLFCVVFALFVSSHIVQPHRLVDKGAEHHRKWMIIGDEYNHAHFIDLTLEIPEVFLEESEVTFYYSSRKTSTPIGLTVLNTELLTGTDFDPNRLTMFIIHGWNNNNVSSLNMLVREAVLQTEDWNIFVVDWGIAANGLYSTARAAVPEVGRLVAMFINKVFGSSISTITLVGHSLGAHAAGKAGNLLGGQITTIVGLDPALPYFTAGNLEERLDPGDAKYVEIIHTCAGFLGFNIPIGHADFYPNGGQTQAGCGLDILGVCAHSRSYQYYAESIKTGKFISTSCLNYENFKNNTCINNPTAFMGHLHLDQKAQGKYYLDTNDKEPFALD